MQDKMITEFSSFISSCIEIFDDKGFVKDDMYLKIIKGDRRYVPIERRKYFWSRKEITYILVGDTSVYLLKETEDFKAFYDVNTDIYTFEVRQIVKDILFKESYRITKEFLTRMPPFAADKISEKMVLNIFNSIDNYNFTV